MIWDLCPYRRAFNRIDSALMSPKYSQRILMKSGCRLLTQISETAAVHTFIILNWFHIRFDTHRRKNIIECELKEKFIKIPDLLNRRQVEENKYPMMMDAFFSIEKYSYQFSWQRFLFGFLNALKLQKTAFFLIKLGLAAPKQIKI